MRNRILSIGEQDMFKKILNIYPNATILKTDPKSLNSTRYHWFFNIEEVEWLGIPREDIQEKELLLLSSLFQYMTPTNKDDRIQGWFDFLYSNGKLPLVEPNVNYRVIQFFCDGKYQDQKEIEQAFKSLLSDNIVIIWENSNLGIMIEYEEDSSLKDEDFLSITHTLESDIFLKVSLFIGKFHELNSYFPDLFKFERNFFYKGMELIPKERTLTFEKVFPSLVAAGLPQMLMTYLKNELHAIEEDKELLTTVQVFLENNMNASLTSKKLYIHRNTLQYRLDKFTEKTGVNLKDFFGAYTMYTACLLTRRTDL